MIAIYVCQLVKHGIYYEDFKKSLSKGNHTEESHTDEPFQAQMASKKNEGNPQKNGTEEAENKSMRQSWKKKRAKNKVERRNVREIQCHSH